LPTARASAHLTTAFHHDVQGPPLENSLSFFWKIQGLTAATFGEADLLLFRAQR
jgi:hypothetical protein